ncbi:phosphopantetheine-binding protein [Paenibacillus lautus]|uniref:phosphopantetheine-binding protein n=1 Tax=Paenibacillus lautus TaxID=1401 RepID=UPI003D2E6665
MNTNICLDNIKSIVTKAMDLGIYPDADTNLIELGLDSIQVIQLIVTLEEGLGFSFKDEDLLIDNFLTIRGIYNLVQLRSAAS